MLDQNSITTFRADIIAIFNLLRVRNWQEKKKTEVDKTYIKHASEKIRDDRA